MIDLHMHSRYSDDGEFTPAELVERSAVQGMRLVSVTDHNCVKANREAAAEAAKRGIRYLTGVEIDCVYEGVNFHVLGYGIDADSPDFEIIEANIREQARETSRQMLQKTRELGFDVTESEMRAMAEGQYWSEMWTAEMFAEVVLTRPEYAQHPLLQPYRENGTRSDNPYVNFYWDFYSQGKCCYVPVSHPPMEEIIGIIHRNHGVAVLAHPQVNLKNNFSLLDGIAGLGIDGIEAFNSYHSPEQARQCFDFAKEHSLFVTCGSDYHGKIKPAIHLGQHGCTLSEEELLGQLPFKNL